MYFWLGGGGEGGDERENEVMGVDHIHICFSRWSLQLLSSSVRLLL